MDVKIEESWKSVLKNEFSKPYFLEAVTFLKTEKALGKVIYPPGALIFNAFNTTPFTHTKVVLLGQDPYHGQGQALRITFPSRSRQGAGRCVWLQYLLLSEP